MFGRGDGLAYCLALRSSCGVAVGGSFSLKFSRRELSEMKKVRKPVKTEVGE